MDNTLAADSGSAMTDTIDVTMPDGTVIQGVPKGTTRAQLGQKYAAHLQRQQAADTSAWKPVDEEAELKSKWRPVDGSHATITPDNPPIEKTATASQLLASYLPKLATNYPKTSAVLGAVGNAIQGGGRELLSQLGRISPYVPHPGPKVSPVEYEKYGSPIPGAAQTVGRVGTDIAEFAAPGGIEETAARAIGEALPRVPGIVRGALSLAPAAVSSGAVNKLQGGSFGEGAVAGGLGGAVGKLGERLAPRMMRSALGVTPKQLRYGVTPGEEALQLPGLTRRGIIESAENKLEQLGPQLDRMVQNAPGPVSLQPAHDVIDKAIVQAKKTNSKPVVSALKDLREQLTTDLETGQPLGTSVSADKARALKQGLETHFEQTTAGRKVREVTREAYHALDRELDQAIAGHEALNRKISSLIVAAHPQGSGQLFMRNVPPIAAMYEAGRAGLGVPGQIGTWLGLQAVTSPTGRVVLAKTLKNAPQITRLGRAGILGAGNAGR